MPWWWPLVIGVGFAIGGVRLALTPVERTLEWDRRTGKAIYESVLARTGSRDQALAAAARFYWWLGLFIGAFGSAVSMIGAYMEWRGA